MSDIATSPSPRLALAAATILAQSKPVDEAGRVLPFEPWARAISQQDRTQPDVEATERQRRGADLDPRMVASVPDTNVRWTIPTIEASGIRHQVAPP